jgi:Flp pilus assembly protein TadD
VPAIASTSPNFQTALAKAQAGDFAEAARLFRAILDRGPSGDASTNLAYCLRRLDRDAEAEQALRHAVALEPDHPGALLNLSSLLIDRFALDEAESVMRRGASAHPADPAIRVNLASALFHQGKYSDAAAAAEAALALSPDHPQAHYTLASIQLLWGRLKEGFAGYEWRIPCGQAALALDGDSLGLARWRGQSLYGKTLLAITEQGMGDTLHFVRYGAMVKAMGGRMILTCADSLRRLMSATGCVDGLLCGGDPRPTADFHAPLLSLPHLFGTTAETIPCAIPYLAARDEWIEPWSNRLGERRRPRIGLVWAGSPGHKNDRNRSLALSRLAPILSSDSWQCVALQVGMSDEDRATLSGFPSVVVLGGDVRDYADTAAILTRLDLLITVDTSVAHLAGALGVPTWVMLPSVPDWRWMLDREDSPWYPSLRLFRQRRPNDWDHVIAAILDALHRLTGSAAPSAPSSPSPSPSPSPEPKSIAALFEAAVSSQVNGRADDARRDYARLLDLKPNHPETLNNLAMLEQQAGHAAEAEALLRRAMAAHPAYMPAFRTLGGLLASQRRYAEAEPIWSSALALAPLDQAVRVGLSRSLIDVGRLEDALTLLDQSASMFPEDPYFPATTGAVLAMMARWEAAIEVLRRAVTANPGGADIWSNLGTSLKMTQDYHGAVAAFRRACEIAPEMSNAQWNLSLLLLLRGEFAEGWERYEWRWRVQGFPSPVRTFPVPPWRGEDIAGKRLLVHWEQGFGDTIQFARLLPLVKAKGARIILECQPQLVSLFGQLDGIDELARAGDPLPPFDYHVPLLSIPRIIGLDLAHPERAGLKPSPFLRPSARMVEKWTPRLARHAGLKVGLVWAGTPTLSIDHLRSPRLPALTPLFDLPGVTFFALQKGAGREDLEGFEPPANFIDIAAEIEDFNDTAAIMSGLDLVISSCTAPAHLAGALGVPTWVMLSAVPDWRWLLERDDVPWYPSARLFRQTRPGDWPGVVDRLRQALSALTNRPPQP